MALGALLVRIGLFCLLLMTSRLGIAAESACALDSANAPICVVAAGVAGLPTALDPEHCLGEGPSAPACSLWTTGDEGVGDEPRLEEAEEEPLGESDDRVSAFFANQQLAVRARRREVLVAACRSAALPRAPPASQS